MRREFHVCCLSAKIEFSLSGTCLSPFFSLAIVHTVCLLVIVSILFYFIYLFISLWRYCTFTSSFASIFLSFVLCKSLAEVLFSFSSLQKSPSLPRDHHDVRQRFHNAFSSIDPSASLSHQSRRTGKKGAVGLDRPFFLVFFLFLLGGASFLRRPLASLYLDGLLVRLIDDPPRPSPQQRGALLRRDECCPQPRRLFRFDRRRICGETLSFFFSVDLSFDTLSLFSSCAFAAVTLCLRSLSLGRL